MGYGSYSVVDRADRSFTLGYHTVTGDSIVNFGQTALRKAHPEMLPVNANGKREARDSESHPNTVPVQIYLDVTGSMREVPAMFIRDGLPKIVSTLIESSVKDVAVMIACIGDHECDHFPLQIGQFESGDKELDMWLERMYVEGGGGGNGGESYLLAWFNALNFVTTDAWEKRKQKGFVFTIGDEPTLYDLPGRSVGEIYGKNIEQANSLYTAKELYKEVCKYNHVFHIHVNHAGNRVTNMGQYVEQHLINVNSHTEIPDVICKSINSALDHSHVEKSKVVEEKEEKEEVKITL